MNIVIDKPELEQLVEAELQAGRFTTPEEAVASALALLRSFGSAAVANESVLRRMIAAGIDEADQGLTVPWAPGEIRSEVERRFERSDVV